MRRISIGWWAAIMLTVASAASAGVTTLGDGGLARRAAVEVDLRHLEQENATLRARADELSASIDAMRHNPPAQERAVRDELGYLHSGEIVIDLAGP